MLFLGEGVCYQACESSIQCFARTQRVLFKAVACSTLGIHNVVGLMMSHAEMQNGLRVQRKM